MERTQQHSNLIAVVIGLVLFLVATTRLPVELHKGRDFILGLSQLGILILFVAVLWTVNKWVALFLVLSVVSSSVPILTFESQRALKCVLFGLGWYYFVYQYGDEKLLMDVICVIAFAHFLVTTVQYFRIPSIWVGSVSGLTYNPNEGSAMFALCFPAFLQGGRFNVFRTAIPYKAYLLVVVAGLVMIGSFGGALAVTIGAVFYICVIGGCYWYTLPVVAAFISLFYVFIDIPSSGVRWTVWKNAFNMYLPNWKWGCGLGHWETISQKLVQAGVQLFPGSSLAWTRLHNTFLNGLVEMGVGFAMVVTGYLIDTARRFTKKEVIPFTALVVILVCCSTNSMFRMNAVNGTLAITWLALLQKSHRSFFLGVELLVRMCECALCAGAPAVSKEE